MLTLTFPCNQSVSVCEEDLLREGENKEKEWKELMQVLREETSGYKMADIDSMFSDLLGDLDLLTQSFGDEIGPAIHKEPLQRNYSIGFKDMNESLNELEDNDLDALMADLETKQQALYTSRTVYNDLVDSVVQGPAPAAPPEAPRPLQTSEPQVKADKVKLALERLKEAKVKKIIVKVWMSDGSAKTLMVDERQTVRDVLDNLFEKTHCDSSVDWSLCETNPELQTERGFEDHERLVDPLSAWPRDTENRMCFLSRPEKYVLFKEPQIYYMWKRDSKSQSEIKHREKELLLQENFLGNSVKVPDLEGGLYLKEDGKKAWKRRYFLLRASGIYCIPKGKTKSSSDLVCFIQFDNVNVYTTNDYKQKYKAPTDFCFILKHPCIQQESGYIKFLCCEDEHTLSLWVNSIRIAKYGSSLYQNYQTAVKRTSAVFSTFSSLSAARQTTPSTVQKVNTNGQQTLPPPPPAAFIDDQSDSEPLPDFLPPPPPDVLFS